VECVAADREADEVNRPGKVVGEALLRLLYRKGVVTPAEIHRTVEALETACANLKAADLVVYAWKDPAFKERLVADGTQFCSHRPCAC
jgi:nitrile hydratase